MNQSFGKIIFYPLLFSGLVFILHCGGNTNGPLSATENNSEAGLNHNTPFQLLIRNASFENSESISSEETNAPVECTVMGDVNFSGAVDLDDIDAVLEAFAGSEVDPFADVTGDGSVDLDDILAVLDAFAGNTQGEPMCRTLPWALRSGSSASGCPAYPSIAWSLPSIHSAVQNRWFTYAAGEGTIAVLDTCDTENPRMVGKVVESNSHIHRLEFSPQRKLLAAMGDKWVGGDILWFVNFYSTEDSPEEPVFVSSIEFSQTNDNVFGITGVFNPGLQFPPGARFLITALQEVTHNSRAVQGNFIQAVNLDNIFSPSLIESSRVDVEHPNGGPGLALNCQYAQDNSATLYCVGKDNIIWVDASNPDQPMVHSSPVFPTMREGRWIRAAFVSADNHLLEQDGRLHMVRIVHGDDMLFTFDVRDRNDIQLNQALNITGGGAGGDSSSAILFSPTGNYLLVNAGANYYFNFQVRDFSGQPILPVNLGLLEEPGDSPHHWTGYFHTIGPYIYEGADRLIIYRSDGDLPTWIKSIGLGPSI